MGTSNWTPYLFNSKCDCKSSISWVHQIEHPNSEAREQYNRLCLYIAKIYNYKGDYNQVRNWAFNTAYLRNIDVNEWKSVLKSEDFYSLSNYFNNRDSYTDSVCDSYDDNNRWY